MKAVSAELAAAIEAPERTVRVAVSVDWDGDGHGGTGTVDDLSPMVGRVSLDQTLTTETPDPVRVVEGSAARAARIELDRGGILYPAGSAEYRDMSSASTNGTTSSISVPPPANARAGDYLLAQVSVAHGRVHPQARPAWEILGTARTGVVATFSGTAASAWAPADSGQTWTNTGGSAGDYSESSGVGRHSTATVNVLRHSTVDTGSTDVEVRADVTLPVVPTGATITHWVCARAADTSNYYTARLDINTAGIATVSIFRRSAGTLSGVLATATLGTHVAGDTWRIVLSTAGTALKAKAWRPAVDDTPGWQASATDGTLTAGTNVILITRRELGNTNGTVNIDWDNVRVECVTGMVSVLYGRWATEVDADPPPDYAYLWDWEPDLPAGAAAVVLAAGGTVAHQPGTLGVHAAAIAHEFTAGTSHTTPVITTTLDGVRLVSFFAFRCGATGSWTVPASQIEREDIDSTHGSVNVALEANTSSPVMAAGSHSLTATSSASTAIATMAIIALPPVAAGDERRHAANHFSRHNPASPLVGKERYGRPATIDVEFLTAAGWQGVRRMTGLTRRLRTSSEKRTAALELLDYRERMRAPVTLIPTLGADSGADGTWVVFQALYASGVPAGPVPRTDGSSLLWVPFYGSLNPVTSNRDPAWSAILVTQDGANVDRPTFGAGPFVSAPTRIYHTSNSDYRRIFINTFPPGLSWDGMQGRLEMWVLGVDSPTTAAGTTAGRTYVLYTGTVGQPLPRVGVRHNGKLFFDTYNSSDVLIDAYESTAAVPSDGEWHFVGVSWDHDLQQLDFRIDTTDESIVTTIVAADIPTVTDNILIASWAPVSDLHVHSGYGVSEPWLNEGVVIEAYLDQSTLQLVAVYDDGPYESWGLIHDVAGGEQATAGWDEDGIFRYRTRRRLVTTEAQTVQRTLTAATSLVDLADEDAIDTVRNIVSVAFTPVTDMGEFGYVTDDTQLRTIPARGTLDVEISFSDPVVQLETVAFVYPVEYYESGLLFLIADSYIVVTANSDGSDDDSGPGGYYGRVTATVVDWSTRSALLRVASTAVVPLYLVAIGLRGHRVLVGNKVTVEARDQASIDRYGEQPLPITAPQWVQSRGVAGSIAYSILGDTKAPAPVITDLEIVGDPRLQLGDRVRLVDQAGVGLDREYWLTGVTGEEVRPGGGYTQRIAARPAARQFIVGSGLVGIDLIGGE